MNILITGVSGQLGKTLRDKTVEGKFDGHYVIGSDIDGSGVKLDITNKEDVEKVIDENNIDLVINCAAYTNVEKAEDEEYIAYKVNCIGPKNLAEVLKARNGRLIHISTDYVYDGQRSTPYKEEMIAIPLNAYGRTKLDGEREIEASGVDHVILRTSWLYSKYGKNFVKTIKQKMVRNDSITVVDDQIGSPTYAPDLADMIVEIVNNKDINGTFHCSNEGCCSWYDLAYAMRLLVESRSIVKPCTSEYLHMRAKRPSYSVMSKSNLALATGKQMPHWMESLKYFIDNDL